MKEHVKKTRFPGDGEDGKKYILELVERFRETSDLDGTKSVTPAGSELQTSSGQALNRMDKGVYKIRDTGVIVRSNHPHAP